MRSNTKSSPKLSRLFASTALFLVGVLCIWLASETVAHAYALGGNPALQMWPFAVAAPAVFVAVVWTVWFTDFFKQPRETRWTERAKATILLAVVLTIVAALSSAPFFKAVL